MAVSIVQGIVTNLGPATSQPAGTRYDHVEIAEPGGRVWRLRDVLVPRHLRRDIALWAIGEFHCREAELGASPAYEIIDFRRADRPAT
jgi:hypothetical protein